MSRPWAPWLLSLSLAAGVLVFVPVLAHPEEHSSGREIKVRVMPTYPDIARRMQLNGKVRLEVTIAPDGRVKHVRPLGGHPVLVNSAVDAVKGWRFATAPSETTETVEIEFKDSNSN